MAYEYDDADNVVLVRCSTNVGWDTLLSQVAYAPMGPAESWRLGNGITVRNHLDQRYFTDSINTGTDNIARLAYGYNSVGNISSIANQLDTLASRVFTYDDVDQILTARSRDYPDTLLRYFYARNGNRDKVIQYDNRVDTFFYVYGGDKLARVNDRDSVFRYTYDALGNIIRETRGINDLAIIEPPLEMMMSGEGPEPDPQPHRPDTITYQYNDAGRLVSVTRRNDVATFEYDGQGRRVKKTYGGQTHLYIPNEDGQVLSEYWSVGSVTDYVYVNGQPLARITTQGTTTIQYFVNDHLGTPVAVTDDQKAVRWKAKWYPFGEVYSETGLSQVDLRFPGQWRDRETYLSYNWNRYYDPRTGRYYEADPLGVGAGVDIYGYARGNAGRYIDAYGLYSLEDLQYDAAQSLVAFGDAVSLGATTWVRRQAWYGGDCFTDPSSLGYRLGYLAGELTTVYLPQVRAAAQGVRALKLAKAANNLERHHMIPWEFAPMLPKGMNVDDYVKLLPAWAHRLKPYGLHTGPANWNSLWRDFFSKNPGPSRKQVLGFMKELDKLFGLTEVPWAR